MVELLGQVVLSPQVVDGVSDGPVLGRDHHLALHQASGGILGIGQRLLDRDPVDHVQRLENGFLPVLVEIFDDIDDVVRFELAHRLGELFRGQRLDDLFPNVLVDLRQNLAVDQLGGEKDELAPLLGLDLFEKVGDVGGVHRLEESGQARLVALLDRFENLRDGPVVQGIVLVDRPLLLLRDGDLLGLGRVGHGRPPLLARNLANPPGWTTERYPRYLPLHDQHA